jgi:hypothetical protein
MNWMVSLLSFPNIITEMREDNTNIQANEQMKIGTFALEFIHEATAGIEPLREFATLFKAVLVKIW